MPFKMVEHKRSTFCYHIVSSTGGGQCASDNDSGAVERERWVVLCSLSFGILINKRTKQRVYSQPVLTLPGHHYHFTPLGRAGQVCLLIFFFCNNDDTTLWAKLYQSQDMKTSWQRPVFCFTKKWFMFPIRITGPSNDLQDGVCANNLF